MGKGGRRAECQETRFKGLQEHMQPYKVHLAVGIAMYTAVRNHKNLTQGNDVLWMGQRRITQQPFREL